RPVSRASLFAVGPGRLGQQARGEPGGEVVAIRAGQPQDGDRRPAPEVIGEGMGVGQGGRDDRDRALEQGGDGIAERAGGELILPSSSATMRSASARSAGMARSFRSSRTTPYRPTRTPPRIPTCASMPCWPSNVSSEKPT